MNTKDDEKFNELIRPFFINKGLPSSDAFLKEVTDAFLEASRKLVQYRKEQQVKPVEEVYDGEEFLDPNTITDERPFVRKKSVYEPRENTNNSGSTLSQRSNRHPRNRRD